MASALEHKSPRELGLAVEGRTMALLDIGATFPELALKDIDDNPISLPEVFKQAPASIVFFYRGQW